MTSHRYRINRQYFFDHECFVLIILHLSPDSSTKYYTNCSLYLCIFHFSPFQLAIVARETKKSRETLALISILSRVFTDYVSFTEISRPIYNLTLVITGIIKIVRYSNKWLSCHKQVAQYSVSCENLSS